MKVTLLVPRLDFVSTGATKFHAFDKEDETGKTMCGREITSFVEQRILTSGELCGRCYASLRTYTGRLGSIPKVRIEQE